MSNYVKATDFAVKDSLASGSPAKLIKGTEINAEFNAIQTAIQTKADTNSPTFTGTPTAPTAALSTENTQLATTAFVKAAIQVMYPVGTLYINSINPTNPASLFGFGTWSLFGVGRALVCIDSSNPLMNSAEEGFGRSDAVNVDHTHGVNDPGHSHSTAEPYEVWDGAGGTSSTTGGDGASRGTNNLTTNGTGISIQSSGVSGANENYQPSIAVYIWKRTA